MKYIIEITSGRTPINLTPTEAYDVLSVAVPFAQSETVESLKELEMEGTDFKEAELGANATPGKCVILGNIYEHSHLLKGEK